MPTIKELRDFFLEMSRRGWAGGAPKTTIPELPGSKVIRLERDDLLYVDCYFSEGFKSHGFTGIWVQSVPAWMMDYHGFWVPNDKRVIPFWQRALTAAYLKGEFRGGRGPEKFQEGPLIYRNRLTRPSAKPMDPIELFTDFEGFEEICEGPELLAWHRFSGMMLGVQMMPH